MAEMENSNGADDMNSPPSNSAGTKRKRESKAPQLKFYAVRIGKTPGIYHSWPDCLEQVKGFPKAVFKSFTSLTEAESFLNNQESVTAVGKGTKFYGVQSGRVPGVYTSWPEVLEQIRGWKAPKHRGFKTRHEAEQFVAEGQNNPMGDIPLDSVENADGPAAKKSKSTKGKKTGIKDEGSPAPFIDPADFAPGEGPLPDDAEDGFDSSIILDQTTGEPRYKTAEERARVKPQAVRPTKDSFVKIYTDGSSLGNGQLGAVGGVGVYFGPGDGRNLSEALTGTRQTNQRAELTALQRALELAPRDRKIVIYSDSNYAKIGRAHV